MRGSLSGNLATMCLGGPYAMAAKFACRDRIVLAMVGDGAMQMQTIAQDHRVQIQDVRVSAYTVAFGVD